MNQFTLALALPLLLLSPLMAQFPEGFETSAIGGPDCNPLNPGTFPPGWFSGGRNPFTINTLATQSASTGPAGANTGANYVFLETSCGGNSDGELYLPTINANGLVNPTLDLAYHMFGASMGSLEVQVLTQCTWTTVWYLAGPQANQ